MNNLVQASEGANAELHPSPILEAVHLRKLFPLRSWYPFGAKLAVQAVEDTSLALYPGRDTPLVGESLSGKTNVARIQPGLDIPHSAHIRFTPVPPHLKACSRPNAA